MEGGRGREWKWGLSELAIGFCEDSGGFPLILDSRLLELSLTCS